MTARQRLAAAATLTRSQVVNEQPDGTPSEQSAAEARQRTA